MTRRDFESDSTRRLVHRGRSMAQGDIWRIDRPEGAWAIKDISRQPWLWRVLIGRRSLVREARMIRRLQGLPGIPRFGTQIDADAFSMELLNAERLPHRRDSTLTLTFFERLKHTVGQMHERGIAHGDLRRKNILVCGNQSPYLIDFTTAVYVHSGLIRPLKRLLFRYVAQFDLINVLKIQRGYLPRSLSQDELRLLDRQPATLRLGRLLRKRIYRPLKHLFQK